MSTAKDPTAPENGLTLKQQLDQANARIAELEPKATASDSAGAQVRDLQSQLSAANKAKDDLASQLNGAQLKITDLEGHKTRLEGELSDAKGESTKLQGEAKTADLRAREKAASHGITAPAKDPETAAAGASSPGEALYEQYEQLKGAEKTEFFNLHRAKLTAYSRTPAAREPRD